MNSKSLLFLIVICFLLLDLLPSSAQTPESFNPFQTQVSIEDPCGFDPVLSKTLLSTLGPGWGYNYDSLRTDLLAWQNSPYVVIDSVGASVQNRGLWRLTITSPNPSPEPRLRIWMHARTHPGEVQGWWVTDEVIKILLGESSLGQLLRERCIFNIMPMYNPDGVELGYPRENAHGIDIESNWNKNPTEPEVTVLRNQFINYMASDSPIRLALNMHSAIACKRYFVYHDAGGTSAAYAADEKHFIGGVRQYFLSGIQDWNYFVSWVSSAPTQYPESWFWYNHREAVMALTYEDMNCSAAGQYDQTAFAILQGIADYLGLTPTAVAETPQAPQEFSLAQNYPNPVRLNAAGATATIIRYNLEHATPVRLSLYDVLGREIAILRDEHAAPGTYNVELDAGALPNGIYFYRLQTNSGMRARRLLIAR